MPCPFPILSNNQAACSLSNSPQFQLVQNTLIYAIISFAVIFRQALFWLRGYQLRICQRIFLQKPFFSFLFPIIVTFLVYLFLLLCKNFLFYFSLSFSNPHPDGGVLDCGHLVRTLSFQFHIMWLRVFVYIAHFATFSPQLSPYLFPTLRMCIYLLIIYLCSIVANLMSR